MTEANYHQFEAGGSQVLLGNFSDLFDHRAAGKEHTGGLVIADEHTSALIPNVLRHPVCTIPAGEQYKTLQTCEMVWKAMLEAGLDRHSLVWNIGGGVVGDLGGFCAATFKRGIDFVQVPTSLLAMTDASIGGKLGIDFAGVKNSVGVFRQPAAVLIDPAFLHTLPQRELFSGMAEIFKHALIGDPELWYFLADISPDKILYWPATDWMGILRQSIAVKVQVVRIDPFEKGLRALLNFGHTIGHALESWFLSVETPITHGEAVAAGMLCETALRSEHEASALAAVLLRFFPNFEIKETVFPSIWKLMKHDKKNKGGKVITVLPGTRALEMEEREIGEADLERALKWYNGLRS